MKVGHKLSNLFQTFPFLKQRNFPKSVRIVEVGPRDGLQNEKKIISTDMKIKFINSLTNCGFQTIEATSFVSPKWVPQMGDATDVYKGISKKENVSYTALVPNMKGLEQALKVEIKEIALFTAASESFCKKNINCTIDESLQKFEEVAKVALQNNIRIRGYISCIMGCPYEGDIDPNVVNEIAKRLLEIGCYEISLGDTIGIGTQVFYQIIEKTLKLLQTLTVDKSKLAAHFHNTYDRAIENLVLCLNDGISVIDSSIGGLGGCPYAQGATGNVSTEDVLYMCQILGIETNLDLKTVINTSVSYLNEFGYERRSSVNIDDIGRLDVYREMLI